ncbi:MAG: hypothetical protein GF401_06355 [Chitinivibrionales bacterium]|nr:hypothetical protein [Chitinivibrionales bacterium]
MHWSRNSICFRISIRPFFHMLAVATVAGAVSGCLSPNVRYTRGSTIPQKESRNRQVPRNLDYRKHYKIPQDKLKRIVDSYLGTPYRRGGMSRKGMDCSGFVNVVFKELNSAKLPRTSRGLRRSAKPVIQAHARPGDLVFFRGGTFNTINHVGIYMGNGQFAHASLKKGVVYSDLDNTYYKKHFAGIRRLF